jgi:hypothetical protein
MAEQPAIYRGLRAVDAVALALVALVLVAEPAAAKATVVAKPAADPSATPGAVAWQRPGSTGMILRAGMPAAELPGTYPVVNGGEVAWRAGDQIQFVDRATLAPTSVEAATGDVFGFSPTWLVWRVREADGDHVIVARPRGGGEARVLGLVHAPAQLGRPMVDGDRVVVHVAKTSGSRLQAYDLATGQSRVLRREPRALLLHPSIYGGRLLYVRSTAARQQLRLGSIDGDVRSDVTVHSTTPTARRDDAHERGLAPHVHYRRCGRRFCAVAPPALPRRPRPGVTTTLWSTALDDVAAYFTRVVTRRGVTTSSVERVALP